MEVSSEAFDLGEWKELVKPHGYLLLRNVARAWLGSWIKSEEDTRYRTPTGSPFLYAVALYEHHEVMLFAERLSQSQEWEKVEPTFSSGGTIERMVMRADRTEKGDGEIIGRATLTPSQLFIEYDTRERLESLKQSLATIFGFFLHFRCDTIVAPPHSLDFPDISKDQIEMHSIVVDNDEEFRLLSSILDHVYFDWSDQTSPALGGETPWHAAAQTKSRERVAGLISEIEGHDIALRPVGKSGFDYSRLRAHVGPLS